LSTSAGKEGGGSFGRVAIFGPGLIGGSVALALRARCPETEISIWGRNRACLEEVMKRGLADTVHTDPATAVADADLVVLCTPIGTMQELAASIAPHLAPSTVVTDAGSVKACVVAQLEPLLGKQFVGAHPMAGSERSGLAAARSNLFEGAPCLVTPTEASDVHALERVRAFWISLGARITEIPPAAHDRLVARLSHLPHAVAFALVNLVADSLPEGAGLLAGGSFHDATRVAASDPGLWTGILSENRYEVAAALRETSQLLNSLAQHLEEARNDSILDFLTRAKEHRTSLLFPSPEETL